MNQDTDFQIESGIPLPEKGQRRHTGLTATMRKMQVGDSITVAAKSRPNVFSVASAAGIKITTRLEPGGSLRVWRMEDDTEGPDTPQGSVDGRND